MRRRRPTGAILAVLAIGAGAFLATYWPRINDVRTGQTPEYPDVQPRTYAASEAKVAQAVKEALEALPRFRMVGSGSGRGGTAIHAVATTRVLRFEDEVTIRVQGQGGRTTVNVRSRSLQGSWDFGQNARNVRELLAEVDARLR